MEARAYLKYLRISPAQGLDSLRPHPRQGHQDRLTSYLMQTPKAASEPMLKLLKSAIANAENNNGMDVDKLVVTTAVANPGPILKRGMPRAQRQIQPHSQENHSHHHRCEREGLSRRLLWDRKLIPTDCASA